MLGIFADPIDADGIAEVLHSPSPEEGAEDLPTRARPISYSDEDIVLIGDIATPDREAHVVADDGEDTPASEGEDTT